MLRNYILIAIRNLKRYRGYSFLNLAGLAAGMACCILILAGGMSEVGTDRFHEKIDSLFVVRTTQHYGSEVRTGTGSVPALGPALRAEYPEVQAFARINSGQGDFLLEHSGKSYRERIQMADPAIFDLFSFPLLKGSTKDLASDPKAMILSASAAGRIFGGEDPVGRILTLNKTDDFRVAGVMKDIPANSSLRFDIWMPLEMSKRLFNRPNYTETWFNMAFMTFVELAPGADVPALNKKIFGRIRRADPNTNLEPSVYPFKDLYLKLRGGAEKVRIFSAIAFLILLIACINFMNLSTARAGRRAREVGLRKVVGADRRQLMGQFFGESLVLTFLSLAAAAGLVTLVLPLFNNLTAKTLAAGDFLNTPVLAGVALITLLTGILAGVYPAMFLSSFRPGVVLKSGQVPGTRGGGFRKALVVIQFALSGALIVGTVVIFGQVRFMKTKSLGLDRERLVYTRLEGALLTDIEGFKQEVARIPGILSATAATHSPTGVYNNGQDWSWEGRAPSVNPLVTYFGVDADFLKTFGMRLVRGESFREGGAGLVTDVIINETFAKIIGASDVVGMRLTRRGTPPLRIAGVVEDFHFTPVDQEIGPLMIYNDPSHRAISAYRFLFVRLGPGNPQAVLAELGQKIRARNPGYPFEYRFLDDDYDALYRSVEREMSLVRAFTVLAILISCLGLFGLAAYTAEQRRREIGIRKVLGASESGIVSLLAGEYLRWVTAANLIAWPVSFFLMKGWLRDYPYRISLGWEIFAGSAAATLFIALATVAGQAIRAARSNPAETLRFE